MMQNPLFSAQKPLRILFMRSNPCNPDVRVLKEVNSLLKANTQIKILAWDRGSQTDSISIQNLKNGNVLIEKIGIKASYGGGIKNVFPFLKFQIKAFLYLFKNHKNFDCFHACDFDTAFVAFIASIFFKKILIYDIFDYYIDAYSVPKKIKFLIKKIDTLIINKAEVCILCSEERQVQILPAKPKKLVIIHNSPSDFKHQDTLGKLNANKIKIAYVGIFQEGRYLSELLEMVACNKDFELHIAGFGVLESKIKQYAQKYSNILFYGKISYEVTLELEQKCDVIPALYEPTIKNHQFAAPNKFYESLFLGKPTVMIKNTGMSQIIQKYQIGEVIEFSMQNLETAIRECCKTDNEEKAVRRKKIYKEFYSWEVMEQRLFSIYQSFSPNFFKKPIICAIFGTRPEAIKMCPLIKELKQNQSFDTIVILSGQHKDMVNPILKIFKLKEDYNLCIATKNQTPQSVTIKILTALEQIFQNFKPNIVLVHGDTSTSFASSLACFYRQIPIGHIEAGLRTYNIKAPFPEEFNRQAISLITNLHFAPTPLSRQNLINEQKNPQDIFVVGNTAIDALKTTIKKDYHSLIFEWIGKDKLIVLTAHRRENIPQGLENIFKAVKMLLEAMPNLKIIYPIHPNPIIQKIAKKILNDLKNIKIIPPLDVVDFHNLLNRCDLILTDSGGIQEEAPSLGKPVLVLRDTTERIEGVEAGTLKLVGTNSLKIFEESFKLLNDSKLYDKIAKIKNPYGDGHSSQKIVQILADFIHSDKISRKGGGHIK